jgi:CHAT domain-containing protein/Tfp pilus assembly protein PilF
MFSEYLQYMVNLRTDKRGHKRRTVCYLFVFILLCAWACITPSIRQTQEQNKGDAFFQEHKYSEAVDHYTLMLNASKKLGIYRNTSMESEVWRKIANCHEMTGQYENALKAVANAMALDSADKNTLNLIEDYRHEGMICSYIGLYYRAMGLLETSLRMSEGMESSLKNTRRNTIAETYLALGQINAVTGRSAEALEFTRKALTIFTQSGDERGEMESYLNMANVFSDAGDIANARKSTNASLDIARRNGMGTSRHYQLLASMEMAEGEYENALRFQGNALDDAKEFEIAGQIVWATVGMGDIYARIGELILAEKYYRDAREVKDTLSVKAGSLDASLELRMGEIDKAGRYFSSEGSLTGRAISMYRMAELMIVRNETDSAIAFLEQSRKSFSETGNLQGLSNTRLLLGKLYIDQEKPEQARLYLDSTIKSALFPETLWQAWYQTGRMYEFLNRPDEAIDSYRRSIEIIEKIRGNLTIDEFKSAFFNNKREVYDHIINILLKNKRTVESFQFSEQARARAFYDILANKKIDFRGSLPGDLISQEQEKRIELQKLYKLLQKSESGENDQETSRMTDANIIRSALAKAQSDYEDLLRKIKLNNPSYAEMVTAQPVKLEDLESELDEKTGVIAYWLSDKTLIAWLITRSGIKGISSEIENDTLSSVIEKVRKAIQSNNREESTTGLSSLYDLLISPFEKDIEKMEDIVIIPNGALHFLPFQALINGKGEYLVQNKNLIYAPSAGVYHICKSKKAMAGSRFLGLALSDIPVGNKAGLPGTDDEVRKILPLFRENSSAFGLQGTETFVKSNIAGFNFIHFATHGSYNYAQPLYSCLYFPPSAEDDGRLNVYEVFEMNLNAKLVTLSACETGLGNLSQGDEIVGLSRAFLFAGSSAVIVSLWAVADYPTALLMTNFYRYLKDHPLQEALTLAQRDVIKVYPQPLYWSPFVLIGNGSERAD